MKRHFQWLKTHQTRKDWRRKIQVNCLECVVYQLSALNMMVDSINESTKIIMRYTVGLCCRCRRFFFYPFRLLCSYLVLPENNLFRSFNGFTNTHHFQQQIFPNLILYDVRIEEKLIFKLKIPEIFNRILPFVHKIRERNSFTHFFNWTFFLYGLSLFETLFCCDVEHTVLAAKLKCRRDASTRICVVPLPM